MCVKLTMPFCFIICLKHGEGPWWPDHTVDLAWCVEFTEHVGRNFQPNYLTAFRKAAIIVVTHSNWGGWHHVEVHDDDWWRVRWEAAGFQYSDILTRQIRSKKFWVDHNTLRLTRDMKEDRLYYVGQHLYLSGQVFINPMVASLPEHAHLFAEVRSVYKAVKYFAHELSMTNLQQQLPS